MDTRTYPISVIIPARNAETTITKAIRSALNAGAAEVVVIDDASTDRTFARALECCGGGRVRLIQSGRVRVGVCVARNMAIEVAHENLIVPLDADDTLMDDSLEYMHSAYTPGTLVYGGWQSNGKDFEAPPIGMLNRKNVAYATWLFEKSAWRKVDGYNPRYEIGGEDWHFMVALVHAGIVPVRLQGAVYHRSVNVGTRTDSAIRNVYYIKTHLAEDFPAFFEVREKV